MALCDSCTLNLWDNAFVVVAAAAAAVARSFYTLPFFYAVMSVIWGYDGF